MIYLYSFTFQHGSINTADMGEDAAMHFIFTFQHGSINTALAEADMTGVTTFTFQHGSINTEGTAEDAIRKLTLHSNMDLLIPLAFTAVSVPASFTFQHGSINTMLSGTW